MNERGPVGAGRTGLRSPGVAETPGLNGGGRARFGTAGPVPERGRPGSRQYRKRSMWLKKNNKSTTNQGGGPAGVRDQRCHRERDRARSPAVSVNGPVPPVLPRFYPGSPFRGCSRGLSAVRTSRLRSCLCSPGAAATPPKWSPRWNGGRANTVFPQDTTLVHGPAVPGSVGARGGSGKGSAGLTVTESRSWGVRAAGGTEPWGALPGPGANPGVRDSQRARGCLPGATPARRRPRRGSFRGAPEPRPSRRAQPGRGGGRGCAGGGGD